MRYPRGGTPDKEANASWHRDLVELSAGKLVALATAIFMHAENLALCSLPTALAQAA